MEKHVLENGPLKLESRKIPNPFNKNIFKVEKSMLSRSGIVYVGRLVKGKGCHILIESLSQIIKKYTNTRLSIIGEGPEFDKLKNLSVSLGIKDKVNFKGKITGVNLSEELNKHQIMVVPSIDEEPFGIVALEGLACGCVVVGSTGGGLYEAIGPGGPLFINGDISSLAQIISKLLDDPKLFW